MGRVLVVFFIVNLFFVANASASSCCGQSVSSFKVLHKYQTFNASLSQSVVDTLGKVYQDSTLFYEWQGSKKRYAKVSALNFAGSFYDRWQWFGEVSYSDIKFSDKFSDDSFSHQSDTVGGLTYEVLPEYVYSWWKPIVYVSALINIPTGYSAYDENKLSEGAGVTGYNQWGVGVGVTLFKVWAPWQLKLQTRIFSIQGKKFGEHKISDFYDQSYSAFLSYSSNFWGLSYSAGLTLAEVARRKFDGVLAGGSAVTTAVLSVAKVLNEEFSCLVSYSDQSLFGKSTNTFITQSYNFSVSYSYQ